MREDPFLAQIALEDIYLTPAEIADASVIPILDEETRLLRGEDGLPIYEG